MTDVRTRWVVLAVLAAILIALGVGVYSNNQDDTGTSPKTSQSAPATPDEEEAHCVLGDNEQLGMEVVYTDFGPLLFAQVPVLMGCEDVPDVTTLWCGGSSPHGPTTVCIQNGSATNMAGYNAKYDCGPKDQFLRQEELVHAPAADALACRSAG